MKTTSIKWICSVGVICIFLPIPLCITSVMSIFKFANWTMWGSWTSGVASCMAAILMWIIFKMQDDKISRNQFDAIFFDMLRTFREIRTETIEKEIEQFVDEYRAHFVLNVQIEKLDVVKIKAIMALFVDIHEKGKSFLSYFRYIERIATYIDSDEQFNEDSRERYAKHFIALLSSNEVFLIRLRMLVGKYGKFKNTTLGKLLLKDTVIGEKGCLNTIIEVLSEKLDLIPFDLSEKHNEINYGDTDISEMSFLDTYKHYFEQ